MTATRIMMKETLLALLVLALGFFNFAHAPVAATGYDAELNAYLLPAGAASVDCGEADDGKGHAPCHACRIGGAADLPPPACGPIGPELLAESIVYSSYAVFADPRGGLIAEARGPPTI